LPYLGEISFSEFRPVLLKKFLSSLQGKRTPRGNALAPKSIDDRFIHIELSRVRNVEETDLKTPESNRRIEIRPSIGKVLDQQKNNWLNAKAPMFF
jgi:hypothetical protein